MASKATMQQQVDILMGTGTALKDFISALVQGVQYNSNLMDAFYTSLLNAAYYNGRKMVLQNALNTYFGLAANTIYIVTASATGLTYDFSLYVPTALSTSSFNAQLTAITYKWCMAGKRLQIVTY